MNTLQLKRIAQLLPKRNNKWYAALEQSGLSACNFFYSVVIINLTSIGQLGVYTFWFVSCQFMLMLTIGLATRQMVLEHANKISIDQHNGFWATRIIVFVLQIVQVGMLGVLVRFYPPEGDVFVFFVGLSFYCVCFNFAELYRQFYYMSARHRLSLCFSVVSLATGALAFLIFSLTGVTDAPELSVFWFLAGGNLVYVLFAYSALNNRTSVGNPGFMYAWKLFRQYHKHGVPATGGMFVTWMQNQSVTPLLMFMLGPIVVGYYSLARMIVTPVNMVTTGLAKSALSQVRKSYGSGDNNALDLAVRAHRQTSMRIVYCYVTVVGLGALLAQKFGMLHSGDTLIPMFVATVLVMTLSNYRFWVSQNFVVRMQFRILLRLGIYASCATVSMMLFGGLVLKSALWVVLAPAIGEIILIYTLGKKNRLRVKAQSTEA